MNNLFKLTLILFAFVLFNDVFVESSTPCLLSCPTMFDESDLKYCCNIDNKAGCCNLPAFIYSELYNNILIAVIGFIVLMVIGCCMCCRCLRRC